MEHATIFHVVRIVYVGQGYISLYDNNMNCDKNMNINMYYNLWLPKKFYLVWVGVCDSTYALHK